MIEGTWKYSIERFFDEKSTLEIPSLIGLKVAYNVRLAPLWGGELKVRFVKEEG